jgi:RNA polymerase sigma factor (sigma-70 family)
LPTSEEINIIARKFLELKNKAKDGNDNDIKKYKSYQNYCANKLAPLVNFKTNRYKRFSNYPDLKQDGFEALMLAFETYNPNKGDFVWWASKYINTRVSRAANAHSTIRYPLKKAKDLQPYKVGTMPVLVDTSYNPLEAVEQGQEVSVVQRAISKLPAQQKKILLMHHEFVGKSCSISKISKELKISRPTCQKLLKEAESVLQNSLKQHFDEICSTE